MRKSLSVFRRNLRKHFRSKVRVEIYPAMDMAVDPNLPDVGPVLVLEREMSVKQAKQMFPDLPAAQRLRPQSACLGKPSNRLKPGSLPAENSKKN